ncbi:Outer membrane lipoprotein slyB precursor [Serratia rubidaea]|uniref:Glycine zipper 2TM domain-containing protein n=1 Tax=Serratia rubidaea TaxID=61652 RepID=A0A448ST44_SERRU|nr:glycine zipper 2TM domain-containing protein [Serratia rubidaea]AML58758.1 Outer membrane lipoprotein pcp precursor [Serratia rubidaea]MBD8451953.1 glycine zipper 2TM domain-containing protein [Serratia rubidaea]MBH1932280.1 glycine zipper 2TM domain-containing protein [Serratia rubidaea]MCR0998352.1 glycine zipper 2TM domain-containing protein [Serratia rubidaea]MDC6111017.1 glycine zipper 2TM domain-containing protein [Serratia rubidaea]
MIKRLIVVALAGLTLAGCANDSMSGDVYTSAQAKQVQQASYGTLVSVRPVKIQGEGGSNMLGTIGGAVIGGFLGNTIGGGTGRSLATAAGAVAGGVAGDQIGEVAGRTAGVELEIRPDTKGDNIVVVQKAGATKFSPGQRVRMARSGNTVTVSPL